MRIDFGYTLQKGKEEKGVAEESLLFQLIGLLTQGIYFCRSPSFKFFSFTLVI